MDDNVFDGMKYIFITLGTVRLIIAVLKMAVLRRLFHEVVILPGKQHMGTDLPLVSLCSEQTEEMKDLVFCLCLLRNGTVVLGTISLYHPSKARINIICRPKGEGTNTAAQQNGGNGSRV